MKNAVGKRGYLKNNGGVDCVIAHIVNGKPVVRVIDNDGVSEDGAMQGSFWEVPCEWEDIDFE